MHKERLKKNGTFRFLDTGEVSLRESPGNQSREPWLMLMARRGQPQLSTLCWGQTNAGSAFARIGTQEGDLVNGFVHEDPYKTRLLGPYIWFAEEGPSPCAPFTNDWYPLLNREQELETVFGFGTLSSRTSFTGISVETTSFIPEDFDGMVQLATVRNESSKKRSFRVYNTWPVNIGDARDIQFSGFNTLMMGGGRWDPELASVMWRCHYGIPFSGDPETLKGFFGKVLAHATSLENPEWSTKYEDFYGHWSGGTRNEGGCGSPVPEALHRGTLPCLPAEELTSAMSCVMGRIHLEPGEEKEIVFALVAADAESYYRTSNRASSHSSNRKTHRTGEGGGQDSGASNRDPKEALSTGENPKVEDHPSLEDILAELRAPGGARRQLASVKAGWERELGILSASVQGDDELNHSFRWLQYQCSMVASLNRMKSRFHSGFEYGYGFRDILQDLLALLPADPARVAETLAFTAEQMFSDGSVYHNFFASAPGNRDFTACDDPLWFVFAIVEYLKETGDWGFADRIVPFADAKEGLPPRKGTILERAVLAVERVWANSDEGLPVMFDADWNDDLGGYPEHLSVMTAEMLYRACLDLASLLYRAEISGYDPDAAAALRAKAAVIRESFARRAIDSEGRIIRLVSPDPARVPHLGSAETDGLTFFEPVAWAGISGIASREEFLAAAEHVERDLAGLAGYAICPADTALARGKLPVDSAAWKRNAPGKKENGGAFRHLESWYIASLCGFALGKRATDIYRRTLPAVASADDPWTYAAERFVFPEYVSGPGSIESGRAGHTWLTGTAPTRLRVFVESIMGIAPDWDGLSVNPCVNPLWRRFEVKRRFRGTDFTFTFENPDGVETGIRELLLDGKRLSPKPGALAGCGYTIPVTARTGGAQSVHVVMGKAK